MTRRYQDLTGQRFGSLVAVSIASASADRVMRWLFRCDCGGERIAIAGMMRWQAKNLGGVTCGCRPDLDITGQTFGRLVAIAKAPNLGRKTMWTCRCACGTEVVVAKANVMNGHTQSCGCFMRDRNSTTHRIHGATTGDRDGWRPEHAIWCGMISRCTNPNVKSFHRYGGRGIRVCERWIGDFAAFFEDMGDRPTPKHSIERKDTDGNYEPTNCVWATHTEQMNNTSRTRRVTAFGKTQTVAQWSAEFGVNAKTIRARLDRSDMTDEEAVSKPLMVGNQAKAWATRRDRAPE